MSRLPWKPLRIEFDLDRRIDDAFYQLIHSQWGLTAPLTEWRPEIDVYETDDAYVVEADVSGVTREDLHVKVKGHWLTLSGSCTSTGLENSVQGLRLERRHGSFSRQIYLNELVDCDRIEHVCNNGIHRIRLSKCTPL